MMMPSSAIFSCHCDLYIIRAGAQSLQVFCHNNTFWAWHCLSGHRWKLSGIQSLVCCAHHNLMLLSMTEPVQFPRYNYFASAFVTTSLRQMTALLSAERSCRRPSAASLVRLHSVVHHLWWPHGHLSDNAICHMCRSELHRLSCLAMVRLGRHRVREVMFMMVSTDYLFVCTVWAMSCLLYCVVVDNVSEGNVSREFEADVSEEDSTEVEAVALSSDEEAEQNEDIWLRADATPVCKPCSNERPQYDSISNIVSSTGWAKKTDHFWKFVTPVYDNAERWSIYQSVQYFIRSKSAVLHFVTVKYSSH